MLLKQSNPEHATNTGSMSPRSLSPSDTARITIIPHNDPLDDVFGSDDSPAFEEGFGDDDADSRPGLAFSDRHHPSDMHRLQQEHTTAGYRDGIAVAKAGSIQAGFDEGFGLGGTIGLKVGRLLGLLEGIAGALGSNQVAGAVAFEAASNLLADARAELDLRSVFSPTFWNEDGTWKYAVDEQEIEGEGEGAILFSHVAEAHPLVKKWTATVEEQMSKWSLQEQLPLLQRRDDEEKHAVEPAAKAKASTQSQSEAKAPSDALSW